MTEIDALKVSIPREPPTKTARNGKPKLYESPAKEFSPLRDSSTSSQKILKGRKSDSVYFGTPVREGHANYMLMCDMLTGIRISVSRCYSKIDRELSIQDYSAAHKLAFDATGNELTPKSKYDFKFKDYCPWVFRKIRQMFNVENAEYLSSLTGKYVLSELGSPGKSGSFFYFSQDYRFIIKTIHRSEHTFILQNLQSYSEHVKKNPHTLISRIFGLHRVKQSGTKKIHFVVMGNVFPSNKDIHEVYDLKGSRLGRVADEEEAKKNPRTVLKDLNWMKRGKKIMLQGENCDLLALQIERDVTFLMDHNIMDYSLLLGIHDQEIGNSDKIRDNTLSLYVTDPETLSRRATAATKSSKAAILKKSNQETPAGSSAVSPTLPDIIPAERKYCVFCGYDGGFQATDGPKKEIYYIGIIDIFTNYGASKRAETLFRSIVNKQKDFSAVNPSLYGKRFIEFMKNSISGYNGKIIDLEKAERILEKSGIDCSNC